MDTGTFAAPDSYIEDNTTQQDPTHLVKELTNSIRNGLFAHNTASQPDLLELISALLEIQSSVDNPFVLEEYMPGVVSAIELATRNLLLESIEYSDRVFDRLLHIQCEPFLFWRISSPILQQNHCSLHSFQLIIQKICLSIPKIQSIELPAILYQLLILSLRKDEELRSYSCTVFTISLMIEEMSKQDLNNRLGDLQATVLHHFILISRQDRKLCSFVLKMLEIKEFVITSFSLAFLVSLSSISRQKEGVLKAVIQYISSYYHWRKEESESLLMGKVSQIASLYGNVEESVRGLIAYTTNGLEFLVPHLCNIGFLLMQCDSDAHSGTVRQGIHIVEELFCIHSDSRRTIWETLQTHLISQIAVSPSLETMQNIHIRIGPVSDFQCTITPTVEHILLSNGSDPSFYSQWLRRILSFCGLKHNDDQIWIVLRKSFFSRSISNRALAVQGYVGMLTNEYPGESKNMSQSAGAPSDIQNAVPIVGFLRRALTQTKAIRAAVYLELRRMSKSISVSPKVKCTLLDLVLQHFKLYLYASENQANFPFDLSTLDPSTDDFGLMISCVLNISQSLSCTGGGTSVIVKEVESLLNSCIVKLSQCSLEDFRWIIDTECDVRTNADCLLSEIQRILLALIDFSLIQNGKTNVRLPDSARRLICLLYQVRQRKADNSTDFKNYANRLLSVESVLLIGTYLQNNESSEEFLQLFDISLRSLENYLGNIHNSFVFHIEQEDATLIQNIVEYFLFLSIGTLKPETTPILVNILFMAIEIQKRLHASWTLPMKLFPCHPFFHFCQLFEESIDKSDPQVSLRLLDICSLFSSSTELAECASELQTLVFLKFPTINFKNPRLVFPFLKICHSSCQNLALFSKNNRGLYVLSALTNDILSLLGDGQSVIPTTRTSFAIVCDDNIKEVYSFLIESLLNCLENFNEVLVELKLLHTSEYDSCRHDHLSRFTTSKLSRIQQVFFSYFEEIGDLLLMLLKVQLDSFMVQPLLKLLNLFFRSSVGCFSIIDSRVVSDKISSVKSFSRLTCEKIIPGVFSFLNMCQVNNDVSEKNSLSRICREGKLIPSLIFQIEQYQYQFLKVCQADSRSELCAWMDSKLLENRDFRIVLREMGQSAETKKKKY